MVYLMPRLHRNAFGFTLVELMVAISILAVLSTTGLVFYGQAQKLARDSRRKQDLNSLRVALQLYYQANGSYPLTGGNWNLASANPTGWIPGITPTYISTLPTDPKSNGGNPWQPGGYNYMYFAYACGSYSAGQFYGLATQLENQQDPDRAGVKDYKWCDGKGVVSNYGWSPYSYMVTSND